MPLVILFRALPGSGKSTLARAIAQKVRDCGGTCAIHSTDDYFVTDAGYRFDAHRLADYHAANLKAFRESLVAKNDVVICDNTNTRLTNLKPYWYAGKEHNAEIVILHLEPTAFEEHYKRCQHGVPLETIVDMHRDLQESLPLGESYAQATWRIDNGLERLEELYGRLEARIRKQIACST